MINNDIFQDKEIADVLMQAIENIKVTGDAIAGAMAQFDQNEIENANRVLANIGTKQILLEEAMSFIVRNNIARDEAIGITGDLVNETLEICQQFV